MFLGNIYLSVVFLYASLFPELYTAIPTVEKTYTYTFCTQHLCSIDFILRMRLSYQERKSSIDFGVQKARSLRDFIQKTNRQSFRGDMSALAIVELFREFGSLLVSAFHICHKPQSFKFLRYLQFIVLNFDHSFLHNAYIPFVDIYVGGKFVICHQLSEDHFSFLLL